MYCNASITNCQVNILFFFYGRGNLFLRREKSMVKDMDMVTILAEAYRYKYFNSVLYNPF